MMDSVITNLFEAIKHPRFLFHQTMLARIDRQNDSKGYFRASPKEKKM